MLNGAQKSERSAAERNRRVLLVPYTYFPDPAGGTEIFVRGLAKGLTGRGFFPIISAPASQTQSYVHDGIPVSRFAVTSSPSVENAYGVPDPHAASEFKALLAETKPAIVHFHALSSAISVSLFDLAREAGAKVIYTYHTPTASCSRGDMMLFGQAPCDGALRRLRCSACTLQGHGLERPFADLLALAPPAATDHLARLVPSRRSGTALRSGMLIKNAQSRFRRTMDAADHVIATCNWVREVLLRNGVPEKLLSTCRQGVDHPGLVDGLASADGHAVQRVRSDEKTLRIAYFGRLHWTKGPDILIEAVRQMAGQPVFLDLYAVVQSRSDRYLARISEQIGSDSRIRLCEPVAQEHVVEVMRGYDLLAVPSRWLETGPLVVLEAFAAGVPVIGSSRGGIAELVRAGVDGLLVNDDDPRTWRVMLNQLLDDPSRLRALRSGVRQPRTVDDVVSETAALYESVLGCAIDPSYRHAPVA